MNGLSPTGVNRILPGQEKQRSVGASMPPSTMSGQDTVLAGVIQARQAQYNPEAAAPPVRATPPINAQGLYYNRSRKLWTFRRWFVILAVIIVAFYFFAFID